MEARHNAPECREAPTTALGELIDAVIGLQDMVAQIGKDAMVIADRTFGARPEPNGEVYTDKKQAGGTVADLSRGIQLLREITERAGVEVKRLADL